MGGRGCIGDGQCKGGALCTGPSFRFRKAIRILECPQVKAHEAHLEVPSGVTRVS